MSPAPETAPRARASGAKLFRTLDWALVRAPLLPVDAHRLPPAASATTLVPDDPRVRAALAVGTEDLLPALARTAPDDRAAPRLRGKLLRYRIRMATRPTPYGLFAGVGLAGWGETTDLALSGDPPRTRARPDMAWLLDLVGALERRAEIRAQLRLIANPTVLVRAGRAFVGDRGVSLRATGAVRRALAAARQPLPYSRLADLLIDTPGATHEKVTALIDELWRNGALVTDLRPPLTGGSPAGHVLDRLRAIPDARETASGLERLLDDLRGWDELPLEDRAAAWTALGERVRAVHATEAAATPVQVDMALALDGHLNRALGTAAAEAGELLLRLSPFPRGVPQLRSYQHAFESRYGTEREVPLLELLDPQFGLGPPGDHGGWGGLDPDRAEERQRTLRRVALDAVRERRLVVELDDELLARLETWRPDPASSPPSLDLAIFVLADSPAAIDAGEFQVIVGPNLGATAAGRNLGRFGDLLAPAAQAALEQAATPDDGRVWAEAVYLPGRARSANVAIRPSVLDREIVIGTTAGVPPDRVIPLDELVVGVRDGRLRVRWPAADADVAVHEGHMLNRVQAPPVLRFLEDVTCDGLVQLSGFDWGPAAGLPFLPRVQRGRVILAPAQWRVPREVADLEAWRERWDVPRHVYLAAGDNRLLLDLDDRAHAEQLREELRTLPEGHELLVQEALPGPEQAWLPGPEGRYVAEIVVPLALRARRAATVAGRGPQSPPQPSAPPAVRLRPPGSDWLYLKLYCPEGLIEELIAGPVRRFAEFALAAQLAEDWFFVRYADPEPHLRLRFRGAPDTLLARLLPQLCDWAGEQVADGGCRRFSIETYEREIERYGGDAGTTTAEAIFAADSTAVAELLALERAGLPTIDRTMLAVISIDRLLADLGLDEQARLAWYRDRAALGPDDGREFRERRAALRRLVGLAGAVAGEPGGPELTAVLAMRGRKLEAAAERLAELARSGALTRPPESLYRSYVHLHSNRLAGTSSPVEERALRLLRRTREGLAKAPVAPD